MDEAKSGKEGIQSSKLTKTRSKHNLQRPRIRRCLSNDYLFKMSVKGNKIAEAYKVYSIDLQIKISIREIFLVKEDRPGSGRK